LIYVRTTEVHNISTMLSYHPHPTTKNIFLYIENVYVFQYFYISNYHHMAQAMF